MGMPETISVEGFVRSVSESGLLSEADLRATFNGLGGEAGVSDARMFARSLVDAGRLTPFQVDAIMEGRLPELRIGNYVVMSRLGAGGMGTVYKARHRSMNRTLSHSRSCGVRPAVRALWPSDFSARSKPSPSSLTPTSSWRSTPVRTRKGCTW